MALQRVPRSMAYAYRVADALYERTQALERAKEDFGLPCMSREDYRDLAVRFFQVADEVSAETYIDANAALCEDAAQPEDGRDVVP